MMFALRRFKNFSAKISLALLCFWLTIIVVYQYLGRAPSHTVDITHLNRTLLKILQSHPEILQALIRDLKRDDTTFKEDVRLRKEVEVLRPPKQEEGYGELGKEVKIKESVLSKDELEKKKHLYDLYKFNAYVSDLISVRRSLPDMRNKECLANDNSSYDNTVSSVIICFHNEAWSVLIRSMHSILDRTQDKFLKEILLIDDFSDLSIFSHLGKQLEDYVSQFPKVKILRTPTRFGLTRARIHGAKASEGDILVFLDSHIECTEGWLEPLFAVLKTHPHSAVVPVIETINDDTFEMHATSCELNSVGGFDWSLTFDWHSIPKRIKEIYKTPCEPVPSPTMAGGLFGIRKDFFEHIGYYDEGLDVWGGENLEISFKLWMCGGSIYLAPCSHIGHVFRKSNPYAEKSSQKFGNFVRKNSIRVAMVWLDDFKQIYFETTGGKIPSSSEYGDISKAVMKRKELNCKSFSWYIENVYPELYVPGQGAAHGQIKSRLASAYCLDAMENKLHQAIGLYTCHGQGGHQFWGLTPDGELRNSKGCVDYSGSGNIVLYPCHGGGGNQLWIYLSDKEQLLHKVSRKCLGVVSSPSKNTLSMVSCDPVSSSSQWEVQYINSTVVSKLLLLL